MARLRRAVTWVLEGAIVLYQRFLSPLKGPTCRFYPTCSHYALEAVRRHGPGRGSWLAVRRVMKCHPFHPGGYDPVPLEWPHRQDEGLGIVGSGGKRRAGA